MLNIYYGEMQEPAAYGPAWFKYSYDPKWFEDTLVQEMMLDVDRSSYRSGLVIESPVLGQIPPERLSGGLQTLIMIYKCPDRIFDATSCGPNCAKWLLEIGKREDVTVNLQYFMPFDGLEPFEIHIINGDVTVCDMEEFTLTSLDYL